MKVKGEAVFVKDIKDWISNAKLFKLDSKVYYDKGGKQKQTQYVIVSAVIAEGPETYIFPADRNGKCLNWGELNGSFKGGLDHKKALNGLGFKIVK
jgi:hypothetical protein